MVMARLHVICGNCGSSDMFSYKIDHDPDGSIAADNNVVRIKCRNCSTIHALEDNAIPEKLKVPANE